MAQQHTIPTGTVLYVHCSIINTMSYMRGSSIRHTQAANKIRRGIKEKIPIHSESERENEPKQGEVDSERIA